MKPEKHIDKRVSQSSSDLGQEIAKKDENGGSGNKSNRGMGKSWYENLFGSGESHNDSKNAKNEVNQIKNENLSKTWSGSKSSEYKTNDQNQDEQVLNSQKGHSRFGSISGMSTYVGSIVRGAVNGMGGRGDISLFKDTGNE